MTIKAFRKFRLNNDTLVVGIDVSKRVHVAAADLPDGQRAPKPLVFHNTRAGFESLDGWLQQLVKRHGFGHVVVALEPTGHYAKALVEWLSKRGYELRAVSPLHTHRAKEMLDGSPLKTDSKDAVVIADLARQGKTHRWVELAEVFQALRYLVTLRHRLVEERAAVYNQLHRTLDLLFPELTSILKDFRTKTVVALLRQAPTPEKVVALGLEGLTQLFKTVSRGRLKPAKAKAVYEAAEASIGVTCGQAALSFEQAMLLDQLEELNNKIEKVEAKMVAYLGEVEYAKALSAVPEIGPVTAAILCGELGDLRDYDRPEQVLKMAGLTLCEHSSGQLKGRKRITKRGRPRVRQAIYLAVLRMVKSGKALHDWYQAHLEKKSGANLLVKAAKRLLRAIFVSVKKEVPFQLERFVPRVPGTPVTSLAA